MAKVEIKISSKMIEDVFSEWEAENPGREATPENISAEVLSDRLMKKIYATAKVIKNR